MEPAPFSDTELLRDYISDQSVTLQLLADKYDVTRQTIFNRLSKYPAIYEGRKRRDKRYQEQTQKMINSVLNYKKQGLTDAEIARRLDITLVYVRGLIEKSEQISGNNCLNN